MTSLIIFIIISLLSYIFSADRKKEKNKKTSTKPVLEKTSKGIDGVFGELKKKLEQAEKDLQRPTPTVQKQVVIQPVEEKKEQLLAVEPVVIQKKRIGQTDGNVDRQQATNSQPKHHPLFANSDDVRRAVLAAEILGPPKAKRK